MESQPAPYLYSPIAKDRFRLLVLRPSSFEEEIQRSLIIPQADLAELEYEVLSYVWGLSSKTVPINLDGFKVPITQNLEYALRYLRRQTQPRRIWVDAVYINQADLDEQSKQVSRTKNIYQQAFNVVMWLGEENEPSEI